MLERMAFSELVECLSFTTIHGTYVWAGFRFSVATAISYMIWFPSWPVAQVLMAFQSRLYLVAHRCPWALKSVVLSSRQRKKGMAWLQRSDLRRAHASRRLPWHSRAPCWQVKDHPLPLAARLAFPQGQMLSSQIFQKSLVLAAVLSGPLMKERQSGQRDQEQKSTLTLSPATCRLLPWTSCWQYAKRASEARRTLRRTALLDMIDFQLRTKIKMIRTNVTIAHHHPPLINQQMEEENLLVGFNLTSSVLNPSQMI